DWLVSLETNIGIPCAAFVLVAWLAYQKHAIASTFLNARPIRFLGRTSYSIYLLHGVFIVVAGPWVTPLETPYGRLLAGLALIVPPTLLASAFSYRFVEVPGIDFGRRFLAWLDKSRVPLKSLMVTRVADAVRPDPMAGGTS